MSEPVKIKMTFVRSTKNKHVFKAGADSAAVSEVYVAKTWMPVPTQQIIVTVEG